ncbi:Fe(II)-dependent sulfonate/alpha-ketoglutarate dioxygenase-like protein [Yamadazyma tenuis]|uniref:Fe(II)-dependent sulfonate/alpha-ketoglutarate dioxygenase-like protein n=1 Tax=Candida tenuis (strain ATCC 10573 / BCRC 21748 / CBS 615 / JCM 9827 / NBRC 10315 / NRRL Y-1498 / VKM Y-70) TaxID=590646 RepID=G3AZZ0_CANTC|nr:Fe(II)-dependent sulfonate/alpha-ketoglutarate dioxygenase-like protein [Yamadazyma tenuis ATCC 10573]EGV65273.1 Fe(II)-dependent sulfonate/alpha-ketoglutarate dioxygenase-like protein [Yamadazyma tenuis ATCC 10573]WEJ95071.1 Fe(II)-dependent sulfonate/alpha-ketoglutarate dioxygenase-like protein [Yamadazyma tenuis]
MATRPNGGNYDIHFHEGIDEVLPDGTLVVNKVNRDASNHPEFLPTWNPSQKLPPLKFFKHQEPGTRADPSFPNLFPKDVKVVNKKVTPKLGTEITGVQLSELNDKGKDELALFVAQRGIVVFREQDFATKGPEFAVKYGSYFGRLHIHPTSGAPKEHPELHITYRRADPGEFERAFSQNTNAVGWHTDVSYELQPPGTTFFSVLEGPEAGGDTIFADVVEAYKRLSPEFQKRLEGLHVLHTSEDQASSSRGNGGIERRKPISSIHPLIRVHPATKEKAIYLNRAFSRRIVELKVEESAFLMEFLYKHIEQSHDLQMRATWQPNTVVVWDNRVVQHSAIIDWDTPVSRHAFRITPQAERPVADLKDLNKEEYDVGDVAEALKNVLKNN